MAALGDILDDYWAAKRVLNHRCEFDIAPYKITAETIVQTKREELVAENPARSLRNYPFDSKAVERARKTEQFRNAGTMMAFYWSSYFMAKENLLHSVTGTLERSGHKKLGTLLTQYENARVFVAKLFDPSMDQGWHQYRNHKRSKHPA